MTLSTKAAPPMNVVQSHYSNIVVIVASSFDKSWQTPEIIKHMVRSQSHRVGGTQGRGQKKKYD